MWRELETCRRCGGTGKHPLRPTLRKLTTLLRRLGASATGRIASAAGIKHTAAHNRLVELQRLGLVDRHREGRSDTWTIRKERTQG